MKKLLTLCLILVSVAGMAQIKVASYKTFAGAASDTTSEGATKSYVLELVNHGFLQAIDVSVFTDYVSGKQKLYYRIYWSNDGTNWPATAADSVAGTIKAGDQVWLKTYTPCGGRYMKIAIAGVDSVQKARIYGYVHAYLK